MRSPNRTSCRPGKRSGEIFVYTRLINNAWIRLVVLVIMFAMVFGQSMARARPRVVVLTDIGLYADPRDRKDPDDAQSIVRLLVYANELDVEGLIATKASQRLPDGNVIGVYPETIHDLVDGYEAVRDNLAKHAQGYPTADQLRRVIKPGNPVPEVGWGMQNDLKWGIGEDEDTEASNHIIRILDRDDPRPVWFLVFGKVIDLGQALWKIRQTRSAPEIERFVSKIRVYDIAGQDNVGAWIAHEFPDIHYIRSVNQFRGIDSEIGDQDVFSDSWTANNIRNHGALGAKYRKKGGFQEEGDTPSFLYLISTGLSDPEQPDWGSWGGRFTSGKQKNVFGRWARKLEQDSTPFFMYRDVSDSWSKWDDHIEAPVARWRVAFQNDFAARMDWSVQSEYAKANHPPIAGFNGDPSRAIVKLTVSPGQAVSLSADGSSDPDGDDLSYKWYCYEEPGSYAGSLNISAGSSKNAILTAPPVNKTETIHIILEVTDDGDPPLTRYRRIILTVEPGTYRWCSWETNTNRFTTFPAQSTSTLVMLDDEIFRNNTWYRDGKPHWAYNKPYLIATTRRDWIEWTPNVITSKVSIKDNKVHIFLSSCTPNFRSFQIRGDDGTWRDCGEEIELSLKSRAGKRFTFRTINLFGVAGPEHHIEIEYQTQIR